MRGAAEKANKNRAAKAQRKEAGFQKPSRADESALHDIRDLKYLLRKIRGCETPKDGSFTVNTEMH